MAMGMSLLAKKVVATKVVAADGTGDYITIQAGIDALPAGGGVVYIKEGTYTISAAIEIKKSNVALFGAGSATLITLANNTDDNGIELGDGANAYSNIAVADLKVDGNSANQTLNKQGIAILGLVTDSRVQRCWVDDFKRDGIAVQANADRCIVTENTCSNCTRDGILSGGSTQGNIISNNICYSNANNGIHIASTLNVAEGNICYSNGSSPAAYQGSGICLTFSSNTVVGNYCRDNYYAGIELYAAENNTVTGNYCTLNEGWGIACLGSYNTIGNNMVLNNSKLVDHSNEYSGIYISSADYNTITANVCSDTAGSPTQKYGIEEAGTSDHNVVLGNVCVGNATGDVLLSSALSFELLTNAEKPYRYITSDMTGGSIASSVTETTVGTCTIPANTITTGIIVSANVTSASDTLNASYYTDFKIKIGAAGSEVAKQTLRIKPGQDTKIPGQLQVYESGQTWSNAISVIVTAQHGANSAALVGVCYSVIVTGA